MAQNEESEIPIVSIDSPPFHEEVRNTIKTSGRGLAGITVGRLNSRVTRSEIEVFGIHDRYKTLCFFIERSSGSYVAYFNLPNPMKGKRVRFVFASSEIKKMQAKNGELAIRVQGSGNENCVESDPFLPTNWFPFFSNAPKQMTVLVNSFQATYITARTSGDKWTECKSLSDQLDTTQLSMRAFDTACIIDVPSNCGKEVELTIRGKDGKVLRDPIRTKINLPCT